MSISSRKTILMKWSAYLACHVMLENSSWSASSIGMEWRLGHCGAWCSFYTKRRGKCNRRRPKESINIAGQWKAKLTEVRHKVPEKGSCIVERGQSSCLGGVICSEKEQESENWTLWSRRLPCHRHRKQVTPSRGTGVRTSTGFFQRPAVWTPYRPLKMPRHLHLEQRTLCWRAGVWSRRSRSTEGRQPRTASRYEDSRACALVSGRAGDCQTRGGLKKSHQVSLQTS